jgi:hypothetical protein
VQKNRTGIIGMTLALLLGVPSLSRAMLIDRGGGLIYDSTLNVTWLQDANYSQTSGYDADGRMNWNAADAWATNLVYGGYSDWRLPTIVDTGVTPGCNFAFSGTDCGYNVQTTAGTTVYSEMASLFYDTLENKGNCSTTGTCAQPGWGLVNTGPFHNLQSYAYWSATEYAPQTDHAWYFNFGFGSQAEFPKISSFYAWAVRDGDVAAVPEPTTLALLSMGLIGLGFARRRKVS